MSHLLVHDARVVTPGGVLDRGWLLTAGERIAALGHGAPDEAALAAAGHDLGAADTVDAEGAWLLPGFVDVHVHGAVGHETMDGSVDGLAEMAAFYARHGVTGFLATTWTGTTDDTLHALRGVARGLEELDGGARLLGAHMEGPYLNPARCGAQDRALIRPADLDEAAGFLDTGVVRLLTLAPEIDGNLPLVDLCRSRGVTVSAGHTDATFDEVATAITHGVSHLTHTFNAMRPLHHREPGTVGAAFVREELTAELIADGVHVHPAVAAALYAARGATGVVLVTDAMRATGMAAGTYPIGDRTVVLDDGAVRLPTGELAGSALTMDAGLRALAAATGRSLAELWPTASRNGARAAGVDDRTGALATGADADLVVVDEDVRVRCTVVQGRIVHRADQEMRPTAARHAEEESAVR